MNDSWSLEATRTALVAIDMQKGILGMSTQPRDPVSVLANAVKLAEAFREKGGLVVLVRVDSRDGKDMLRPVADAAVPHRGPRPKDWSVIAPELGPQEVDHVVTKHQWGAFYGTDLDLQLRRRGINTVVLCGISTNIGVEMTAREAYQHNYQQIFAVDAMAAMTAEEHDHTCRFIFPRIGRIRSTEEIVEAL